MSRVEPVAWPKYRAGLRRLLRNIVTDRSINLASLIPDTGDRRPETGDRPSSPRIILPKKKGSSRSSGLYRIFHDSPENSDHTGHAPELAAGAKRRPAKLQATGGNEKAVPSVNSSKDRDESRATELNANDSANYFSFAIDRPSSV